MPVTARTVAAQSIRDRSLISGLPRSMTPGYRSIAGTRMPPFHRYIFSNENGPLDQLAGPAADDDDDPPMH